MKSIGAYVWAASTFMMAVSSFLPPSASAEPAPSSQPELPPMAEPYEPGSSTVVNEWQFHPGEKTTIATNFRSHHHHSGHCRNSQKHHSST